MTSCWSSSPNERPEIWYVKTVLSAHVRDASMPPSPSSMPDHLSSSLSYVEWTSGDVFDERARYDAMSEIDVVVSCVGAFGSNEYMQRACGDATIAAITSARERGVRTFGFVSSAQVYDGSTATKLPSYAPMYGYFEGKRRAEEELIRSYPNGHAILRPGFIYGPRRLGGRTVPLQLIGGPIDFVGTRMGPMSTLLQRFPFVGKELSSMVRVESVGRAMIGSVLAVAEGGGRTGKGAILDAESIRKF